MRLEAKVKSENLLERKRKLNEELVKVGLEIVQVGKKIEKDGLEKFINSGNIDKPHDLPLDRLKRRCEYLRNMARGLDKEIGKARRGEREAQAGKIQRKMDRINKDHDRMNQKGHDLRVALDKLKNKARGLNEEMLTLKQEFGTFTRADHTETLKLTKQKTEVAEFVAKFYVADVEELKKLIEKTREGNKFLLSSDGRVRPVGLKRMDVFLGFELCLNKDSGEILKKKPITRSVGWMTSTKAMVQEVI